MITSSQIIEEFEAAKKIGKNYIEVFSNPTLKELIKLGPEIRFLADDSTKKIYVCDAVIGLHNDMKKIINLEPPNDSITQDFIGTEISCSDWLEGLSRKRGSVYVMTSSDLLEFGRFELKQSLFQKDWSWVDRYILVSPYLQRMQNYVMRRGR